MEFIEPDRSNYIVSAHKPNDEGVRDIGFVKGTFLDGRPYRLEWAVQAGMLVHGRAYYGKCFF